MSLPKFERESISCYCTEAQCYVVSCSGGTVVLCIVLSGHWAGCIIGYIMLLHGTAVLCNNIVLCYSGIVL